MTELATLGKGGEGMEGEGRGSVGVGREGRGGDEGRGGREEDGWECCGVQKNP